MEHVYTWTEPDIGMVSTLNRNFTSDPAGRYMILGSRPPVVYDTTTGKSLIFYV